MSCALLQDPEKIHDILDDLESAFWVMVFCALQWFLPPGQICSLAMFDEEKVDDKGRTVGGVEKFVTLFNGLLYLKKFTCPILQELIYECAQSWGEYHLARRDDPRILKFISESSRDRVKRMLESASQPVFWKELYMSALDKASSCSAHEDSSNQSGGDQLKDPKPASTGDLPQGKKRAGELLPAEESVFNDANLQEPRPPKRTRVQ